MEQVPNVRFIGKVVEGSEKAREKNNELIKDFKQHVFKDGVGVFSEDFLEALKRDSVEKTPDHIEFIRLANEATNVLMKESGVESYDVPEQNYFMVGDEAYEWVSGSNESTGAFADNPHQLVFFRKDSVESRLGLALSTFHETLHLKGKIVMEAVQEKDREDGGVKRLNLIRAGWSVISTDIQNQKDSEHGHFIGLHEAVVVGAQRQYFQQLLQMPQFSAEKAYRDQPEVQHDIQGICEEFDLDSEDIFSIDIENEKFKSMGYAIQYRVLSYVCDCIAKDRGMNRGEVFKMFLNSQFTGNIVSVGKLVEQSFGNGGFRRLGDMDTDDRSGIKTIEALRKMRLKVEKEKNNNKNKA